METTERAAQQPSPCLNCGSSLSGQYCARCGQEATSALRPVVDVVRALVEDFASFDAKIFLTLRQLLFSPGLATTNYIAGKRAPYTPPMRLYIIISAISIALMSITGFISLDSLLADAPAEQIEILQQQMGIGDLTDPAVIEKFDNRIQHSLSPVQPDYGVLSGDGNGAGDPNRLGWGGQRLDRPLHGLLLLDRLRRHDRPDLTPFLGPKPAAYLIDVTYQLVYMLAMGAVLGAWR